MLFRSARALSGTRLDEEKSPRARARHLLRLPNRDVHLASSAPPALLRPIAFLSARLFPSIPTIPGTQWKARAVVGRVVQTCSSCWRKQSLWAQPEDSSGQQEHQSDILTQYSHITMQSIKGLSSSFSCHACWRQPLIVAQGYLLPVRPLPVLKDRKSVV